MIHTPTCCCPRKAFEAVAEECHHLMNRVSVIDLSSFGKIEVTGTDASSLLDRLCANNLPKIGMTNISHMLTDRGRVYAELTVSRLEVNSYYCVTGAASEVHDIRWMSEVARDLGFSVNIRSVSDTQGVLGLAGPFSRRLMSLVAPETDFSSAAFPFLATRWCLIDGALVRIVRLSYTGELGYEIYTSHGDLRTVYTSLMSVGQHMGIGEFGSYAMNSLRIEKGFRGWGAEMNMDTNPLEAGLGMFIKSKKDTDFIGRSAIAEIRRDPSPRVLVQLSVNCSAGAVDPIGNETVWFKDKVVGNTTSGAYSHITEQSLCFAYVPVDLSEAGTTLRVELLSHLYEAHVLTAAPLLIEPVRERNKKNGINSIPISK